MEKQIFKTNIVLDSYDVDVTGRWKPASILRHMTIVAQKHCDILNPGDPKLEAESLFWVLLRVEAELKKLPRTDTEILIETAANNKRGRTFCRYFRFLSADETICYGIAKTYWVVLERESRKMGKLAPENPIHNYQAPDVQGLLTAPKAIKLSGMLQKEITRCVQYSDLDDNGHMNNTRYAEWAEDMIGYETLKTATIKAFDVNFIKEAAPNTEMQLSLYQDENVYYIKGIRKETLEDFFIVKLVL